MAKEMDTRHLVVYCKSISVDWVYHMGRCTLYFIIFSALRVFALWDRNIPMTLLVLALNLVPVATDIIRYLARFAMISSTTLPASILIELGTRIALIVGDALVLAVTWVKTARNLAEGARIGMRTPLSTMLLRDGTIYFALQPILISRFLLNLRQVGSPEIDSQEAFNSQFSVPGFRVPSLASIVGNMGNDLEHGDLAEEVDDEVENTSGSIQAEEGAVPEAIIETHFSSMNPTPSTSRLADIA
ncbi:hypothetical protein PHLCEN_2v1998 [Hermanssonia centrifuga]|uniref:Uncharacterized protein n=1 Tax=Hermanssonia centrifuga TaxID=98765 RepID=A0A2R6RQG3_9APHY|nr:hypothetical protein PHLCEN_2v1998 [Hermanssonia centrifuga]